MCNVTCLSRVIVLLTNDKLSCVIRLCHIVLHPLSTLLSNDQYNYHIFHLLFLQKFLTEFICFIAINVFA